jgi:hypothetical protein
MAGAAGPPISERSSTSAGGYGRIGAEIFDIFNGVSGFGAGLASNVSDYAILDLDASVDQNFKGLTLKPSLEVDLKIFQIAYGYGIWVDHASTSRIRVGNAVGLGFRITDGAYLQAYYNQIALYYLGVTFKI